MPIRLVDVGNPFDKTDQVKADFVAVLGSVERCPLIIGPVGRQSLFGAVLA